jgi:hypothetical protein
MGLFTQAADAAEAASGAKVVTSVAGAAYGLAGLPLGTIVSIATLLLTLFYIWGALPRVYRTAVALKRGLINKDWSLWQKLGDQPTPTKDD